MGVENSPESEWTPDTSLRVPVETPDLGNISVRSALALFAACPNTLGLKYVTSQCKYAEHTNSSMPVPQEASTITPCVCSNHAST